MPLACDPLATVRIVLDGDKEKTPTPVFLYRPLTYRQWVELQEMEATIATAPPKETIRRQQHWLQSGLVGWEHIDDPNTGTPLPFAADRICDLVSMFEAQEILQFRLMSGIPSLADKKKLPSPSDSATEKSANPVAASPGAPIPPTA
jgi:hypothetical protein